MSETAEVQVEPIVKKKPASRRKRAKVESDTYEKMVYADTKIELWKDKWLSSAFRHAGRISFNDRFDWQLVEFDCLHPIKMLFSHRRIRQDGSINYDAPLQLAIYHVVWPRLLFVVKFNTHPLRETPNYHELAVYSLKAPVWERKERTTLFYATLPNSYAYNRRTERFCLGADFRVNRDKPLTVQMLEVMGYLFSSTWNADINETVLWWALGGDPSNVMPNSHGRIDDRRIMSLWQEKSKDPEACRRDMRLIPVGVVAANYFNNTNDVNAINTSERPLCRFLSTYARRERRKLRYPLGAPIAWKPPVSVQETLSQPVLPQ